MEKLRLPPGVLFRTFLRSFFLQASWNFERLQNLGFLYSLVPALRFLYRDKPEELTRAYRRHLENFNTHPFMASPVLGTVLALEEKEAGREVTEIGASEFKAMVMAPYAAMGDALFWGGIRPLASGVALFFAAKGSFWAPVVFLLLFNLPHLWMRTTGLLGGYFRGLGIVERVQRRRLPDLAIRLKEGTVVLLGGLSAYLTFLCLKQENFSTGWGLLAVPAVLFLGWAVRRGGSTLLIMLVLVSLLLGFGLTGVF
jgi:PTS system mannose-specific IID component